MTQEGVYNDDHDEMDSVTLEDYFKARNPQGMRGDVPPAIDHQARRIEEEQQVNIRHEAVDVPANELPFAEADILDVFCAALDAVQENGILPSGLGIQAEEWDEGYPASEVIRRGRRGTREQVISLPVEIWRPRAERWCQGLSVMLSVLDFV